MAGGCGKTGNAIQLVEWFDGVSFRNAFEVLAGRTDAAFAAGDGKPKAKKTTVPKLDCPLETDAADGELMEQVVDYYYGRLKQSGAAKAYLAARGLDDGKLVRRFRIGFADRTLGLRMPHKNRATGAELRARLTKLGVYRKSGHEHLNGCIVVPVAELTGGIRQLYGRRIEKAAKDKRHLYLARPLEGVFTPAALGEREIILCESIIDALTLCRHGMGAATCTFGTANFSAELFGAIKAAKIESVRIAFDADNAGDEAAERVAKKLAAIGVECHRVRFPLGQDANSYALDQGGEALRKAVKSAQWIRAGTSSSDAQKSEKPLSTSPSSLAAKSLAAKKEMARCGREHR
jgi:DNA primase